MDLARGHWALGEYDDAIFCLERVAADDPTTPSLLELTESFASELAGRSCQPLLVDRLNELCRRLLEQKAQPPTEPGSNLATSTLAELLERQGHGERALEVAAEVLQRSPYDERARAVRARLIDPARSNWSTSLSAENRISELERWLENLGREKRSQPGGRSQPGLERP